MVKKTEMRLRLDLKTVVEQLSRTAGDSDNKENQNSKVCVVQQRTG